VAFARGQQQQQQLERPAAGTGKVKKGGGGGGGGGRSAATAAAAPAPAPPASAAHDTPRTFTTKLTKKNMGEPLYVGDATKALPRIATGANDIKRGY
jgi:hypothetical protein